MAQFYKAVVEPFVQELLNEKISERLPTAITILDFYLIVSTLIFYMFSVTDSIDRRSDDSDNKGVPFELLLPLYVTGGYFAIREFMQMISFIHLGLFFSSWFKRATNWMEISVIVQIFFWTVEMEIESMPLNFFQIGTSITL